MVQDLERLLQSKSTLCTLYTGLRYFIVHRFYWLWRGRNFLGLDRSIEKILWERYRLKLHPNLFFERNNSGWSIDEGSFDIIVIGSNVLNKFSPEKRVIRSNSSRSCTTTINVNKQANKAATVSNLESWKFVCLSSIPSRAHDIGIHDISIPLTTLIPSYISALFLLCAKQDRFSAFSFFFPRRLLSSLLPRKGNTTFTRVFSFFFFLLTVESHLQARIPVNEATSSSRQLRWKRASAVSPVPNDSEWRPV